MSNDIAILEQKESKLFTKLTKHIDENSKFDNILSPINEGTVKELTLDCSKLQYMNSAGIRSFIDFVEYVTKKGCSVIYTQCSTILVSQFNMVKGFFPANTSVESFYCPYFNPATDEEKQILVFSKDVKGNEAPEVTDSDGNELEFDGFKEKYFQFLQSF